MRCDQRELNVGVDVRLTGRQARQPPPSSPLHASHAGGSRPLKHHVSRKQVCRHGSRCVSGKKTPESSITIVAVSGQPSRI